VVSRGNRLATVRIYKVAELLGTTSQEVTALLKRDHGIEVKSASSTIEEVVARQFVERLAKQRGITLPTGDIFAEAPAAHKTPAKKGAPARKAPEPQKPAAPALPPPRLVKTVKPAAPAPVAVQPPPEPVAAAEPAPPPPAEPIAPPAAHAAPAHPAPAAEVRHQPAPEPPPERAPAVAAAPVEEPPAIAEPPA